MYSILLTFDLEYWFESLSIQKYLSGKESDSLENIVNKILKELQTHQAKATFFVTGKVLDNEPELIKKIYHDDHEIAIHSLDHQPLWHKNPYQFDMEIKAMIGKIEKIISQKPIGHRAVNFSLDHQTQWAVKILAKNNIKYDSSIFPFKLHSAFLSMFKNNPVLNTRCGINCHPRLVSESHCPSMSSRDKLGMTFKPYQIDLENITTIDKNSPLIEFPISVFHINKFKMPLAGGIYIRLIPWFIFKNLLKIKLKQESACLYFHPFDFLDQPPDLKMPEFKKFIKYFNTKNSWRKFNYIISNFKCVSIKTVPRTPGVSPWESTEKYLRIFK